MSVPAASPFKRLFESTVCVPFIAVGFVLAGCLTFYCTDFVKISWGRIYVIEIAFLICLGYILLLGTPVPARDFIRIFWPPIPFFVWGCVLLFVDLLIFHFHKPPHLNRIMQHSLIFMYPLMWTVAGGWLELTNEKYTSYILYGLLFLNILPNFWGATAWNIALGPLVGIPFALSIRALDKSGLSGRSNYLVLAAIGLTGFLFYSPFYRMWQTGFQRTYLVAFVVMLVTVPLLAYRSAARKRMLISIYFICFLFFLLSLARSAVHQLAPADWRTTKVSEITTPRAVVVPVIRASSRAKATSAERVTAPNIASVPVPSNSSKGPIAAKPAPAPVSPSRISFKHFLLKRIQHAEDMPVEGNDAPLQMRTRRFMWRTALSDSKKRPFIGVGFIPEIPSWVGPTQPNTGNFEKKNSPPVSGPHNSYLSIFVRMGIPGMILFFVPAGICLSRFLRHLKHTGARFMDLVLFFVVINGCIYGLFNVELESPARAFPLWLAFGVLLARSSHEASKQS